MRIFRTKLKSQDIIWTGFGQLFLGYIHCSGVYWLLTMIGRGFQHGSAGLPPKIFSGGLRRTSGERSANSAGIRVDSVANWRKSSLKKCPPTKPSLIPWFPAEKLPPRTSFRRENNSRVRVRFRGGGG